MEKDWNDSIAYSLKRETEMNINHLSQAEIEIVFVLFVVINQADTYLFELQAHLKQPINAVSSYLDSITF